MLLKVLLIIFGIPILILPFFGVIVKKRKLTGIGIVFIISVILFSIFQYLYERNNSKIEKIFKYKIDSINIAVNNLRDSLTYFKEIILSVDNQLYITRNELTNIVQKNDSLNKENFESSRPILNLTSTEIKRSTIFKGNYGIEFQFANLGVRAVTNVHGKMYTIHGDTITENGSIPISKSDIYANKKGFTIHSQLKFNPESKSLLEPIYYYFKLTYSDIISKQVYPYEIVMKFNPFDNGKFMNELILCRNWEKTKIKSMVK